MSSPAKDVSLEQSLDDAANYGSRTASGNARLFNCKQCNRAFTREEHLTRHTLLTHNKLKPFVCGICHRPFSRRDLLLRHAKNLHQGSEKAVSRIRKLYKRSLRDSRGEDEEDDGDGDGDGEGDGHNELPNERQHEHQQELSQGSPLENINMNINMGNRSSPHSHSDILQPLHLPRLQHLQMPHTNLPHIQHQHLLPIHGNAHEQQPMQATNEQISDIRLTSEPIIKQGYDTPEKKRLKMSVNMLVS